MTLLRTFLRPLSGLAASLSTCILKVHEWLHRESPEVYADSQAITLSQKPIIHQTNLGSSQLYRLPTELLCLVDKHLDVAGKLAIRAACSALSDRLGKPKYVCLDGEIIGRAKMSEWMIRQLYPRLCRRERRVGRLVRDGKELFLCQPCAARHPAESFTRKQLEAGPEVRRCRGQDRVFRVCRHLTVDFNTITEPLKRIRRSYEWETPSGFKSNVFYIPGRIDCAKCRGQNSRWDKAVLTENTWAGGKSYSYERELFPHSNFKWQKFSLANSFVELAVDDTPLCPHVSIRDLNLESCFSRTATLSYRYGNNPRETWSFWWETRPSHSTLATNRGEDLIIGKCSTKDCPLKFEFLWRDGPIRLVLNVRYDLRMTSPDDPAWIAITHPMEGKDEENLFTLEDLKDPAICQNLGLR